MTSSLFRSLAAFILSSAAIPVAYAASDIAASDPTAFGYEPQGEDERSLWMLMDEQEQEIKRSKFLIKDPELNAYLRKILCDTVGESCGRVRLYLMRTPYFNAAMAPNGMMIVWSGLLLRARNEAELASVLGHEFSHFEKLHSLQSFRNIRRKTDAMTWLSFVPYVGFVGQYSVAGSIFSFNRDMERQADMISLDYLAENGYDPMAASSIWKQLRAEMDATAKERKQMSKKDLNGGFFATHPNSGVRMAYLQEAAQRKPARKYRTNGAEYRAALSKWWPELIDDQIKLNDFGATSFLLGQLAGDGWTAELLYARAELFRARDKPGDLETATGYYRQSIAADKNLAASWRGLGTSLLRSGLRDEGREALRAYLRMSPEAGDRAMIGLMAGVPQ